MFPPPRQHDGKALPPQAAGLTWRALSADLVPAWLALYEAARAADDGHEFLTAEDLLDEIDADWIDLGTDTTIGFDAEGVARAFGIVQVRPGDVTMLRAHLWGTVHPQWRRRGIGSALLAWQESVARRLVARRRSQLRQSEAPGEAPGEVPGQAWLSIDEHVTDAAALAQAAGYTLTRWFSVMRRDLAVPGPDVDDDLPPGLRLVRFADVADAEASTLDEAILAAHNDAFADHWGFQPWAAQAWRQWESGYRWFRPDWTFAVLDGDLVVAYATGAGYEPDWARQGYTEGWTSKLGVRRAWRGRGLARLLLAEQMTAFRQARMAYAGLDVDSENISGAVRLYTGLGYEALRRSAHWSKPV